MKHVNVVTRIILLMGLFSYGIARNFGLYQFWACKCPPGFYAQGTNAVYASVELCKDKNDSFIVEPSNFKGDVTTPSHDTNNLVTILEACSKCAHGCATCKGPEADDCLECVVGYFAHPTKPDVQNKQTKRSSESRLSLHEIPHNGQRSVNSQKIFEEDELLKMDGVVRKTRDENAVKPIGIYSQNVNEDTTFGDFKDYDDEESSGEIDEAREALEVYISEQSIIPQVLKEETKPLSAPENVATVSSVNLENKDSEPELSSVGNKYKESAVTKEDENDSKQPVITGSNSFPLPNDQKATVPALITDNDFKYTHPMPTIENVNTTETTNREAADEPVGRLKINNESSTDAASTSEKSLIWGNAILTNTKAPLQNPIVTKKTTGSALITTASYSCLSNCPDGHYNTSNRLCLICHAECEGCFNDGPTNCIKCRNYKKGSTCVVSCTSNETSTEKYNSNCELQSEDETIPAGYYAIPPLVILLVCACLGMSYCRKQRKLKNALPGLPEGMRKTDMQSSEISFTRTHLDQKKCFYKGSKPPSHIALTEFKNSSETLKRKGNPYVYTERPLLPKYAHQTATHSPAWSACKDMSEPEDEFDPLYETPDNTMDLEALKRYHYRRRSSPSHVHFALTTSKVKEVSKSLDDCRHGLVSTPIKESVQRHTSSMETTQHIA